MKVAAGWNHTVVLTDKFDVYSAGLGNNGQLGHGDEESKKVFTWVKKLGGKKVKDVYAGGAHSWCILDPEEPVLRDYSPPSPLRPSPLNSPLAVTPKRDGSVDGSFMREPRTAKHLLFEGATLQLMIADQQKSHRFARMTIDLAKMDTFNRLFLDYIKKIQDEEGGLLLYNIQKDEEVFQDTAVGACQAGGTRPRERTASRDPGELHGHDDLRAEPRPQTQEDRRLPPELRQPRQELLHRPLLQPGRSRGAGRPGPPQGLLLVHAHGRLLRLGHPQREVLGAQACRPGPARTAQEPLVAPLPLRTNYSLQLILIQI